MHVSYSAPSSDQPPPETDPARLPILLRQVAADLADPAVTYLLGGHYYDRTNHPRYRHFPAVFALRQGEVSNFEVGPDFVAFDTEFVRYPERGERGYPGPLHRPPSGPRCHFAQLYQLCRKVLTPAEQAADDVSYGPETIVIYYNAAVYKNHPDAGRHQPGLCRRAALGRAPARGRPDGRRGWPGRPRKTITWSILLISTAPMGRCCWECCT